MATIGSVEEIQAWQKARELTSRIYEVSSLPAFTDDHRLRSQIRAAAVSITSNIAEGFQRAGNKEFLQFLAMAKGSTGEVKSQLYTALDAGFIGPEQFEDLRALANDTENLIGGFMRYLRSSDLRGPRFK